MFTKLRIATLSALVCSLFWAGALSLISDEYIKLIDQKDVKIRRYQILLGETSQINSRQQEILEYLVIGCTKGNTIKIGQREYKCYVIEKA